MSRSSNTILEYRYTEIGALSEKARKAVNRLFMPLAVALVVESAYLSFSGRVGATAFALMALGCLISLGFWRSGGIGLPLLPLMAFQSLIIYGVPIVVGHEIILSYPESFVMSAGEELLIFQLAMAISWRIGMQLFYPSPPVSFALREFNKDGVRGWSRLGFGMIAAATGYLVLQSLNLTGWMNTLLPFGSNSIIVALTAVVSACGFFLVSVAMGYRNVSVMGKVAFWILLFVNGMISAEEFLLYNVAASLITVAVGFFWGSGKVPWRYLTISMLCLSFLNTGKTTMRERYWNRDGEPQIDPTLQQLPGVYAEWAAVSYNAILENETAQGPDSQKIEGQVNKNQTLLDRIDNLQNLLFVIDAIGTKHLAPLHGVTYSLIPPLLVPRILWPDKPRSHEGQILLNVHFGRQELSSTFETYIAWGLLPEAYGNFGPIMGALILGTFLGIAFAWIENLTSRKPVLSIEGFLSLSLLISLMNSFEMVASVLVTSTFQSFIVVIAASAPFVRRMVTMRPATAEG
jgi:hypothetical protein